MIEIVDLALRAITDSFEIHRSLKSWWNLLLTFYSSCDWSLFSQAWDMFHVVTVNCQIRDDSSLRL